MRLEMLASTELATAPAEEVADAYWEPSEEVAEAMSDSMEESNVVCEPIALPATEVRELTSERRDERASEDCARAKGLLLVRERVRVRRRVAEEEEEREKRIFGLCWMDGGLVGWLTGFGGIV